MEPNGKTTTFAYTSGRLTTVTYPDAKVTAYSYDANDNLTRAQNHDGYHVNYFYYSAAPYKVSKVTETHTNGSKGQDLSISYGVHNTTFTDYKGRQTIYQFNRFGNPDSIRDISETLSTIPLV